MTIENTDIDLPEVLDELEVVAMAYERALVGNDAATLDALFWHDARALRYGIADTQHGIEAVRAFRNSLATQSPARDVVRLDLHTFGRDCAVVNIEFRYRDRTGGGRQSQTWIRTSEPGYAGWRVASAHVDLLPPA